MGEMSGHGHVGVAAASVGYSSRGGGGRIHRLEVDAASVGYSSRGGGGRIYRLEVDANHQPLLRLRGHHRFTKGTQTIGPFFDFTAIIVPNGTGKPNPIVRGLIISARLAKFRSLGILVKADVESLASKNPKELTALLEQIAGSDELRREYDDLEEQKTSPEEKSTIAYQEKKTIVMERKQKKVQKEEAEKHLRLQHDMKLLKTEHLLWQLHGIEKDMEN